MTEYHRGNKMHKVSGLYIYSDTKQPVKNNPNRECGYCKKENTPEGHDGCLGDLPYVMNACCGHGDVEDAYVQFNKHEILRSKEALAYFVIVNKELK